MNETPEEIRARIDRTRQSVSGDVDALAEKVSPSGIVGRETERAKGKLNDVKDRLFGSDDHDPGVVGNARDDVRHAVGDVGDSMRSTADRATQKAKGNPLAVGLIAFGVGALIASLIPASSAEKDAAGKVKDAAQPLVDEARDVAKEAAEHLKEPAQEAAQSVKDAAQSAGEHVKDEAQAAAADVSSEAQSASDEVRATAQDATQRVQDERQR